MRGVVRGTSFPASRADAGLARFVEGGGLAELVVESMCCLSRQHVPVCTVAPFPRRVGHRRRSEEVGIYLGKLELPVQEDLRVRGSDW